MLQNVKSEAEDSEIIQKKENWSQLAHEPSPLPSTVTGDTSLPHANKPMETQLGM